MSQPIPKPKGLPIVGNITAINPNNTWQSLKHLAEEHGEIFQLTILGRTLVFVAGAALATEITDETRFRKFIAGPIVEIRAAVHDSLFTAFHHEESWGVAHRIIAPRLSPEVMTAYLPEMAGLTRELIGVWKGFPAGRRFELVEQLNRLNLEATTLTLYGARLNGLEGPPHPMLQAMETSTSEAVRRPTRPGILNTYLHGGKFKRSNAVMREYAEDMVRRRKGSPTDRDDLLAHLLRSRDPETGKALTESQVIDEIITMPIGSSTAPCLLAGIIYHLLKNPDIISKAREEIDTVLVGIDDDDGVARDIVTRLPYVQAIVHEGLRLCHPGPGYNIEPIPTDSKQPVLLGGGKYSIAHDQPLILVLSGANRDPTVFEDPLSFRPERMLADDGTTSVWDQLPRGVTRGFGNGKRACTGKHYAWRWSVLTLAQLLRDVDFTMADPSYDIEKAGMDGWFNVRPIGFEVKVKPRAR